MAGRISLDEFIEMSKEDTVTDYNNPTCKDCNDSCSIGTLLTDEEYRRLKNYVNRDKKGKRMYLDGMNLFMKHHSKGSFYAMCLFSDPKNKKCKIYPFRPSICKDFHCKSDLNKADILAKREECKYSMLDVFLKDEKYVKGGGENNECV